jgi:thiol-disulfide isomerase/thioredoxin
MKKFLLFIVLATLCLNFTTQAQDKSIITALKIGDQVPEITITNIINHPSKSAKISDFKDKLLILDFMNTYCGNCIEALPRLDTLQKKYFNRLQIIVVSNETATRMQVFLKNNVIAKEVSLPFVAGDKALNSLFPHEFVPHEVWIYKGTVKAITTAEYVNGKNIEAILNQVPVNWEVKTDLAAYDYHSPLLVINPKSLNEQHAPSNFYYTTLTGYLPGVATRYTRETDSVKQVIKLHLINYSILDLYRFTLGKPNDFPYSHIRIMAKHPEHFIYRHNPEYRDVWNNKNTWCYEGVFPAITSEKAVREKIKIDLDFYLHLKSNIETVSVNGFLLKRDTSQTPSLKFAGEKISSNKGQLDFITVDNLLVRLNHDFINLPFFSDLPPACIIDFKVNQDVLSSPKTLEEALRAYHLSLQPCIRSIPMLILSDADTLIQAQP